MSSVAILGTIALDSIHTPHGATDRGFGGSAAYASIAASLFSPVHILSVIGKDFPSAYLDRLTGRNINIEGIQMHPGDSFHWKGYYEADMGQAHTLETHLNVLLDFEPKVPPSAKDSRIIFLGNLAPDLQEKTLAQFSSPELVILDSMNFWIEHHSHALKAALSHCDILILNDQEICQLTQMQNLPEAMTELLTWGPNRIIVKKGAHGAMMLSEAGFFACPALPISRVMDPTGAGDSFAGGLAGYLAQQPQWTESVYRQALIMGTLIAANTVQGFSLDPLEKLTLAELKSQYTAYKAFCQVPDVVWG